MKYYKIHCETPSCDKDAYYYYRSEDSTKVEYYAADYLYRKANEWYKKDKLKERYDDFIHYFQNCSYDIKEITKEEFYDTFSIR